MADYLPDPGRVFESDVHRRVLGHLPLPSDDAQDLEWVLNGPEKSEGRLSADEHNPFDANDHKAVEKVLRDLEADGHAKCIDQEGRPLWKQTKKGLDALCAPVPEEEEAHA